MRYLLSLGLLWSTAFSQHTLEVAGLPEDAPLTLWASATPDALTVAVTMKPGWHLYARDVGGGQPVKLTLERRSDFVARGPLAVPAGDEGKLTGAFRLVLPLKKKGRGRVVRARLDFMACDPVRCLPPMSVQLRGDLRPLKVLLVVDREDERSRRIADFLAKAGMQTKTTTYGQVTTRACDAHDVVLADSRLFKKNERGSIGRARGFPPTESPIVAVGFLGTELIEGHKLAMTSGYI